jgi:hypothetical protein
MVLRALERIEEAAAAAARPVVAPLPQPSE